MPRRVAQLKTDQARRGHAMDGVSFAVGTWTSRLRNPVLSEQRRAPARARHWGGLSFGYFSLAGQRKITCPRGSPPHPIIVAQPHPTRILQTRGISPVTCRTGTPQHTEETRKNARTRLRVYCVIARIGGYILLYRQTAVYSRNPSLRRWN